MPIHAVPASIESVTACSTFSFPAEFLDGTIFCVKSSWSSPAGTLFDFYYAVSDGTSVLIVDRFGSTHLHVVSGDGLNRWQRLEEAEDWHKHMGSAANLSKVVWEAASIASQTNLGMHGHMELAALFVLAEMLFLPSEWEKLRFFNAAVQ